MEEHTNFWNKTAAELTVKDQIALCAVLPVITIGGLAACGLAVNTVNSVRTKVSAFRANRKNKTEE